MKESQVSRFLISFNGNIEYVRFPAGVFDENLYLQYDVVWGPDWEPISGLCSGTSQIARSGNDPEKVIFNMPLEMTFGSTNVYGWPQIVITVRARSFLARDSLRGYALFHFPPVTGSQELVAHIIRPRSATWLGEWISWITGRNPELVDPKMLASGQENYSVVPWWERRVSLEGDSSPCIGLLKGALGLLGAPSFVGYRTESNLVASHLSVEGNRWFFKVLRTESYGTVLMRITMVSKDLRKLGYDNQPAYKCNDIMY